MEILSPNFWIILIKKKAEYCRHVIFAIYKTQLQEILHFDGLVQEGRNSSALAMELRLTCTNPSMYIFYQRQVIASREALIDQTFRQDRSLLN